MNKCSLHPRPVFKAAGDGIEGSGPGGKTTIPAEAETMDLFFKASFPVKLEAQCSGMERDSNSVTRGRRSGFELLK